MDEQHMALVTGTSAAAVGHMHVGIRDPDCFVSLL